ncbi:MAG: hypothetical protein AAGJ11_04835 [Bacteroidota bacterium]
MVAAVAASGCASSELRGLRNDLDRSTPGLTIHDGRSYSFGPVTLGFARLGLWMAGGGEDAAMARAVLGNAWRVQFAQYEVEGEFTGSEVSMPDRLRAYLDRGWVPALALRGDDEVVWLLANDRHDRLEEVLLVTLSADELVLAKVRGNLTEVARLALREALADDESEGAEALTEETPQDETVP